MTDRPLRLLLNFDISAKRDEGQTPVFLHRRDRKFALTCEEKGLKPSPSRWLAHVNHFSSEETQQDSATKTIRFWKRVSSSFVVVGAILGVLTMFGLLFYDGGLRINVTVIMAFVAFQLLLSLLTTVQSLVGWQPWRAILKRFQKTTQPRITTKLQGVLMARSAQLGGMCFALTGLITLLLMVVLQDLAFGWSTTLETQASSYHKFITAVAAPWAWLWPAAVPELALVEATRFFRADIQANNLQAQRWGEWWPFIAMLWTSWALLPRVVLYVVAGLLLRHKAKRLLNTHPAMRALQYRMETPSLDTGNEHNDASDLPNTNTQLNLKPLPNANVLVYWAGAGDLELPDSLSRGKELVANTGGRMTLAEDQSTLEQVSELLNQEQNHCVLIATRSWEPPTGELEDFILRAESLWPKDTHIVLVPLATSAVLEPNPQQIQQWLRFAKRISAKLITVSVAPTDEANIIANRETVL